MGSASKFEIIKVNPNYLLKFEIIKVNLNYSLKFYQLLVEIPIVRIPFLIFLFPAIAYRYEFVLFLFGQSFTASIYNIQFSGSNR